MTFKHTTDSEMMRSLEKVAREKGLIKDEPLKKAAAVELNLKPSNNLMENILNLCAGLRVSGFDKYANELEVSFLNYKSATSSGLYDTDPKAGEKEIQTAHPDGSHKLQDVAGDHSVLTVLDKHLKMLEVSNKDPNGKLESSASVLRAVKKVLGQVVVPAKPAVPQPPQDAEASVTLGIKSITNSVDLIINQSNIGRGGNYMKSYLKEMNALSMNINVKNVMEIRQLANKILEYAVTGNKGIFSRYFGAWFDWAGASITNKYDAYQESAAKLVGGGFEMEEDLLKNAIKGISDGINNFGKALKILGAAYTAEHKEPSATPESAVPEASPVLAKIKSAQMALAGINGLVNAERRKADPNELRNVDKWLKETSEDLAELEKNYDKMSPEDALAALVKITADFSAVKKDWS